ncbi:hypothetical protein LCGC14_1809830 [marine sediment metagenome]|uniref:Uncharacterized protein n=1 Tax=marine sediment metagenome TaxID=412755 RepID=A0A0F9GLZ0_9ZZZZ
MNIPSHNKKPFKKPAPDIWILTRIIEFGMSGFIRMIRKNQELMKKWRKGELPDDFDVK